MVQQSVNTLTANIQVKSLGFALQKVAYNLLSHPYVGHELTSCISDDRFKPRHDLRILFVEILPDVHICQQRSRVDR